MFRQRRTRLRTWRPELGEVRDPFLDVAPKILDDFQPLERVVDDRAGEQGIGEVIEQLPRDGVRPNRSDGNRRGRGRGPREVGVPVARPGPPLVQVHDGRLASQTPRSEVQKPRDQPTGERVDIRWKRVGRGGLEGLQERLGKCPRLARPVVLRDLAKPAREEHELAAIVRVLLTRVRSGGRRWKRFAQASTMTICRRNLANRFPCRLARRESRSPLRQSASDPSAKTNRRRASVSTPCPPQYTHSNSPLLPGRSRRTCRRPAVGSPDPSSPRRSRRRVNREPGRFRAAGTRAGGCSRPERPAPQPAHEPARVRHRAVESRATHLVRFDTNDDGVRRIRNRAKVGHGRLPGTSDLTSDLEHVLDRRRCREGRGQTPDDHSVKSVGDRRHRDGKLVLVSPGRNVSGSGPTGPPGPTAGRSSATSS